MKKFLIALTVLLIAVSGYLFTKNDKASNIDKSLSKANINSSMKITSSAFENNENIPKKYSCDGQSINPPLQFLDVPQNAKSLVLIVDDPDAPMGTFDHWVLFNMEPKLKGIEEGNLPNEVTAGKNSAGQTIYTAPCPPPASPEQLQRGESGTHRYFFKLYALDEMLDAKPGISKKEVENAMQGHVIASSELVGLYSRSPR